MHLQIGYNTKWKTSYLSKMFDFSLTFLIYQFSSFICSRWALRGFASRSEDIFAYPHEYSKDALDMCSKISIFWHYHGVELA